jgi:hypothetical protein
MNGPAFEIIHSAAEMRGHLILALDALVIVVVSLTLLCIIQEHGLKKAVVALGWVGSLCLALIFAGACALLAVGLL